MFSKATLITFAITFLSVTTATPVNIETRQDVCSDVFVYFARGTTEVGTLGTIVGPGFQSSLATKLASGNKSLTFTGVPYPASVAGYLAGGDEGGATTMANLATTAANNCPNAKIVISGYSQGAQVTHKAAAKLPSSIQNRIVAAVTFGDPYQNYAYPGVIDSRKKIFCATGDLICLGQIPIYWEPHYTYGANVGEAADFVVARV